MHPSWIDCINKYVIEGEIIMNQSKTMRDLVGQITSEGKEITYEKFLRDLSGMDEIYDDFHLNILDAAKHPDNSWVDVEEILAPLTGQILIEAIHANEAVYSDLIDALKVAYHKLKEQWIDDLEREKKEFESDREFLLDLEDPSFLGELDGFLNEIAISGKYIKHFENEPLGKYRFVVGYKKEEMVK